ncbi:MAG: hypothetical protein NTZ83_04150 [Candidatus Pacearchaeota archaeon]|nr:hypothetical protein [Candidatus Pacearchaeota archaeon]
MAKDKLKKLRTLESICIGGCLGCIGGFLTGALIDNDALSLISGGAGLLSAGAGLYASHRQTALESAGYRADRTDRPDADDEADDADDAYNADDIEKGNAQKVMLDLGKVIGAKAEYHPELKVISKDPKAMFSYLCKQAGEDNDKLHELQDGIRYIHNFPAMKGFFMKNFGGYNKI